jgi:glycosidase
VYRNLLRLRRENIVLQAGSIQLVDEPNMDEHLLAYRREFDGKEILVAINFGKAGCEFQNRTACKRVLFKTGLDELPDAEIILLPPCSGVILGQ